MKLSKLIAILKDITITGETSVEISSVTCDSRLVERGSLFVALKGLQNDGHQFIDKAVEAGAVAVIYEDSVTIREGITYLKAPDTHLALGLIASEFYGNPSRSLRLVGITGTNGKTTTVTLLYQMFTALGYKCGLISTIANYIGDKRIETIYTTPDPVSVNRLLAQMAQQGCEFCFMEVSSHSIHQKRIAGLHFTGAIFSNITHDHLDYHKTFLDYIRVKKSFFDSLPKDCFALTNIDDKNGMVMTQNCRAQIYTYSCLSPANFNCRIIESGIEGMLLRFSGKEVWTRFIGTHNAYNLLAVYSAAVLLGASDEEILTSLSALKSVSGRLEYIKGKNDLTAVVDYAHTPDALENVLKTLKDCAAGRTIITVFGCGGNRDRAKRPEMAKVSAKYSDKIVVTSDNPRFEDPVEIIEEIKSGYSVTEVARTLFITDRKEAIKTACALATPGSIILVAGKGHETYQEIKGERVHFDDKEIIEEIFKTL